MQVICSNKETHSINLHTHPMKISTRVLMLAAACGTVGVALTSCFDDKYDLSDIDKTVRVNVDDLVIPINIENVTLGNLITINPDDRLQIVNGAYCVVQDGEFTSSDIVISPVSLPAPVIQPTVTTITLVTPAAITPRSGGINEVSYKLHSEDASFEYTGNGSASVTQIEKIYGSVTFTVRIAIGGLEQLIHGMELRDLVLQLPAGLDLSVDNGGVYDSETGLLSFSSLDCPPTGMDITVNVREIDFPRMGGVYSPSHVKISGNLRVVSGELVVRDTDIKSGLTVMDIPHQLTMTNNYTMSSIDITNFTGRVHHKITGVNINDIDLADLPDAVTGEGTVITLANPQIYLQVVNPVSSFGLRALSGLSYTSYPRYDGGEERTGSLETPLEVSATGGIDNFCLAPHTPELTLPDYPECVFYKFESLSYILNCGNGVPSRIGVHLDDPEIPEQTVTRFELGTNLGQVSGKYSFVAPLAFGSGSKVVYSDVLDGWGSDVQDITVENLTINLTVDSDLPLGVTLTGEPIDASGNPIPGIRIEGAEITPAAKGQNVSITTTGSFSGMDGVRFTATVEAGSDQSAITPDMGIKLTNVRPRVSGYYQKEL